MNNENDFVIPVKSYEAMPSGNYLVEFVGVKPLQTSKGDALRWEFEIEKPNEFLGRVVSRLTATAASQKNSCGKTIKEMSGNQNMENFNPKDYVGKKYLALLAPKEGSGFSEIITLKPTNKSVNTKVEVVEPIEINKTFELDLDSNLGGLDTDWVKDLQEQVNKA